MILQVARKTSPAAAKEFTREKSYCDDELMLVQSGTGAKTEMFPSNAGINRQ
jgi:hypothetical protein